MTEAITLASLFGNQFVSATEKFEERTSQPVAFNVIQTFSRKLIESSQNEH